MLHRKDNPVSQSDLGSLISALGAPWFLSCLQGVLQGVFQYDYFLFMLHGDNFGTKVIASDFRSKQMDDTLTMFEQETYLLNPDFRLFQMNELPSGVHSMESLARLEQNKRNDTSTLRQDNIVVDQSETLGFRTKGWPEHLHETCLVTELNERATSVISLYTHKNNKTQKAVKQLSSAYPLLANLIQKHFEIARWEHSYKTGSSTNGAHSIAFNSAVIHPVEVVIFFKTTLNAKITDREADVFALLLQGKTPKSIACDLGISLYTVQTHRRNVYRRIGQGRLVDLIRQFQKFTQTQAKPTMHNDWQPSDVQIPL